MTQSQLEEKIEETISELRDATANIQIWALKWVEADNVYRQAKANCYLNAEGKTIVEKEAQVDLQISMERQAAHQADRLFTAYREVRASAEAELGIYKTMLELQK